MACITCNGYDYCKCYLLKLDEEIRIKKLELDSLELEKIKLIEKYEKWDRGEYDTNDQRIRI